MGSLELFQRLRDEGELTMRVWQSIPAERLPTCVSSGCAPASATTCSAPATSRCSWTGRSGRPQRGCSTARESRSPRASGSPRSCGRRPRPAGRSASTRSGTPPTAPRSTRSRPPPDDWRPLGLRQRIEHAQLLDPAELPRFAALGVAASVQFSHAPSDRDLADRVWEGHAGAYAYRSLLDAGARLANGSDAPVEELDPLHGHRGGGAAYARRAAGLAARAGADGGGRRCARPASTPAWLARDEDRRGTLAPGKLADLVVLDRDPRHLPAGRATPLSVVATIVGGHIIHVSEPGDTGHTLRVMKRESWLPAAPESAPLARAIVRDAAAEYGLDGETTWDLMLATSEAVANAVLHGASCGNRRAC